MDGRICPGPIKELKPEILNLWELGHPSPSLASTPSGSSTASMLQWELCPTHSSLLGYCGTQTLFPLPQSSLQASSSPTEMSQQPSFPLLSPAPCPGSPGEEEGCC